MTVATDHDHPDGETVLVARVGSATEPVYHTQRCRAVSNSTQTFDPVAHSELGADWRECKLCSGAFTGMGRGDAISDERLLDALAAAVADSDTDPLPLNGGYSAAHLREQFDSDEDFQPTVATIESRMPDLYGDGVARVWGIDEQYRPVVSYLPSDHPRVEEVPDL